MLQEQIKEMLKEFDYLRLSEGTKERISKRFAESLTLDREKMRSMIDEYWRFDENQQHLHTWHDREDFFDALCKSNVITIRKGERDGYRA